MKPENKYYTKKMKKEKQCLQCFVGFISGISTKAFCSKKCRILFDIAKHKVHPTKKKCQYCSSDFYASGNNKKYCSEKCRYNYWVLANEKRVCKFCKKEFDACQEHKGYCSVECRKSNWLLNPKRNERDRLHQLEYIKQRRKSSVVEKLKYRISDRIRKNLRNKGFIKGRRTHEIIGCSISVLKSHLENSFLDGMQWNNHSIRGWHIDHIIPLSSAKTEEDLYKLWHYTNLQPLWWLDNLKKGSKYVR